MLVADLSQLPQSVRSQIDQIFRQDHEVKLMRALEAQKEIAADFHRHRPKAVDGLGEQRMALHPYLDACNRAIVGSARWSNDRDLRNWYLKRFPEARVRSTGTKAQVGFTAPRVDRKGIETVSRGNRRFTKVYADT